MFSDTDPRVSAMGPEFRRLLDGVAARFTAYGRARRGRAFHLRATTLRGTLLATPDPALPANELFGAGRAFGVIVRHANGAQDDDAACDNRGATVRLLDPYTESLDAPVLDLLLTTGWCFLQGTAADFDAWTTARPAEREARAAASPAIGAAAWDMVRHAESYATLHYHSKVASLFLGEDGARHLARFRLIPADRAPEGGFADPGGRALPPDLIPRAKGDARPRTFLHDELRARLAEGPVTYLLQAQVRPEPQGPALEAALDCTRRWSEDEVPFRDLARLDLDGVLDDADVDGLAFNPGNAPPSVGLVLAEDPRSTASLNHLRSLVYEAAADERRRPRAAPGKSPPPSDRKRVCVIGAGVSGLTAARELEKRGHRVTVLERATEVGGKCGSVAIGDHWYDLGGHYLSLIHI